MTETMVAIVGDEKVIYRGNLPNSFRSKTMNVTGLRHLKVPSASAKAKGILPLEIVKPKFDSATHRLDGFTDTILKTKVIQTYIVRERTQKELEAIAKSNREEKIQAKTREMAVSVLIENGELPADYQAAQ